MSETTEPDIERILINVAQLLDGWHNDGTAWTEWDESVRRDVTRCREAWIRHRAQLTAALQEASKAQAELEALRAEYARATGVSSEDDAWTLEVPGDDKACVAEYRIRWLRVKMWAEALESRLAQEKERGDRLERRIANLGLLPSSPSAPSHESQCACGGRSRMVHTPHYCHPVDPAKE